MARCFIFVRWESNDIEIMEEYPENLLSDVDNFFTPYTVGSRAMHIKYEADWSLRFARFRVFEVRQQRHCAMSSVG